jgi:hypothetical protein
VLDVRDVEATVGALGASRDRKTVAAAFEALGQALIAYDGRSSEWPGYRNNRVRSTIELARRKPQPTPGNDKERERM